MNISKIFRAFFHIERWHFYISDIYLEIIQQSIWRKKSLLIGNNIKWLGFPIITNEKGATIEIGNNCLICSRPQHTALGVSHKTIIRTLNKTAKLTIGDGVRMSGTTICSANSIIIGDRCVIGSDAMIVDTDFHSLDPITRSSCEDSKLANSKPVIIGNDVFIGGRSIILKGVILGNGVIVGAGSIVTKSFPEGSIISGNPAKLIGNI
jgi:acetyltransferase-like isoleucine patch superfamily enzyme